MSSGKSSRSDGPGASDAVITPAGDAGAVAGSSPARTPPAGPADKNMEASTMTPTRHAEADADHSARALSALERVLDAWSHYLPALVPAWRWAFNRLEDRRAAVELTRCPLCDHAWRRHDPEDGQCDAPAEACIGPCPCGRDLPWVQRRIAALSSAALDEQSAKEGTDG